MPQVAKVLLKHDKTVIEMRDNEGRTCLHWSAKTETTKCLELLLKSAPPGLVNIQDHECVCCIDVVLRRGSDRQVTALHWAVLCDHPEHIQKLLKVPPLHLFSMGRFIPG
jgi:ankyrin repeat protein